MNLLSSTLNDFLPLIAAVLLVIGMKVGRINLVVAALWLSLIALLLHYQTAGGEILGNYFGYKNAAIYTLNLVVLVLSLIYLLFKLPIFHSKLARYLTGLISACLVVGSLFLLINLWMNAAFIENRRPGTPIMQVISFEPLAYCSYRYVFYRVETDGKVGYLCPNHYGLVPSIGKLEVTPEFILNHLTKRVSEPKK